MKKIVLFVFGLSTQFISGQESIQEEELILENEQQVFQGKNMITLNALALSSGTFSLQYERLVSKKTSVGVTLNFMSERGIPFSGAIESLVSDRTTVAQLKAVSVSNFSFTPEARFYLGKEGFKGFYISPFVRFSNFSMNLPVNYYYEGEDQHIMIDGKTSSISAGVGFGAQWKLSDNFYLDWMIIGPHYGGSTGTLSGQKSLNQEEQDAIIESLRDLDIPVVSYDYEVDSNGAKVKLNGPWAGIRAVVGVGYRF